MLHRANHNLGTVIAFAAIASFAGCDSPKPTFDIHDPDPSLKIPAIKIAVAEKDMTSIRQFVRDLDSDDSAVRFYSIEALQRLTGETFGYQYYDDDSADRAPAINKWKRWLVANDSKARDELKATASNPSETMAAATQSSVTQPIPRPSK